MYSQKRIKTVGCDVGDISQKKQLKDKVGKSNNSIFVKQTNPNSKSFSKDITPKKNSTLVKRSNVKDLSSSSQKIMKSKHLTSICSYSIMQKESEPTTKRKTSYTHSIKKKMSKNKSQIEESIKDTVNNFNVLTECLTEYIKEQKKNGKNPNTKILHLIKAFNRSQVGPLSKDVERLIGKMLNYIQDNVHYRQSHQSSSISDSLSEVTLSNEDVSSKQERRKKLKTETQQIKFGTFNQSINKNLDFEASSAQFQEPEISNKRDRKKESTQVDIELERQLQKDVALIKTQLSELKSAGKKLQSSSKEKDEDIRKLEEMVDNNRRVLDQLSRKKEVRFEVKEKSISHYSEQQDQSESDMN